MGWVMLFSWPLMCAIQEIAARIGRVTGRGIAGNLKAHYPCSILVGLLFVANVINLGVDLGAMGSALALVVHGPPLIHVALFTAVTILREAFAGAGTIAVAVTVGVGRNFTPIDPVKALFWSAVINGVVAVPVMVMMRLLTIRPKIMGRFTLPVGLRVVGWAATLVMALAAVGMFATTGAG